MISYKEFFLENSSALALSQASSKDLGMFNSVARLPTSEPYGFWVDRHGNKFMQWFPKFQTDRKSIGLYLPKLQDWVADMLLSGKPVDEGMAFKKAKQMVGSNK